MKQAGPLETGVGAAAPNAKKINTFYKSNRGRGKRGNLSRLTQKAAQKKLLAFSEKSWRSNAAKAMVAELLDRFPDKAAQAHEPLARLPPPTEDYFTAC